MVETVAEPQRPANRIAPRPASHGERLAAFAFASAEMVAEVDEAGLISYAAGAFRSRLGAAPEAWVGRNLKDAVAAADHDAIDLSLNLLSLRGRLLPLTVRLANPHMTQMALAGMRLTPDGGPLRLCMTLGLLAAPLGVVRRGVGSRHVARTMEARLRANLPSLLGLVEVVGASASPATRETALLPPDIIVSTVGPGRYGLVSSANTPFDLVSWAASFEEGLRAQGVSATVSSRDIAVEAGGLTWIQAARALRQALDVFARDGTKGLDRAGFQNGLAGYVEGAMRHTAAMRLAIQENRFSLAFQPIVGLGDRVLHHYEALLRPRTVPGFPARTPQDFVLLAETVGLSLELDLAVAGMACSLARRATVPVAFNVSGQAMLQPLFRERLLARLAQSPARRAPGLMVEMTETAQLEDMTEVSHSASAIRDIGVRFCLDDFGAGAADLRVLRAVPADIVKIEGSYIPGIVHDGRDRSFVAGMIEIAHACGTTVVGEKVETEEEARALLELGADYGQGWLFGRPASLPGGDGSAARPFGQEGR